MSTQKQLRPLLSVAGRVVVEYLVITLGVLVADLGLDWLIVPNHLAAGGIMGLVVVLNAWLGWPVGLTFLLINVPLLLAGFRYLGGREFILRTLYATILIGLTVDPLALVARPLTYDPILATLYGGVLVGIGTAIIYHWRSSTAGTDIIALLLKRFAGMKVGTALLATDGLILLAAGLLLNLQLALYALVCLYIKSKVVDSGLQALKARNLSRVRRPTGLMLLPPSMLSHNRDSLAAATHASGGRMDQGLAAVPLSASVPPARRLLSSLLMPYASLNSEGIGGQEMEKVRERTE